MAVAKTLRAILLGSPPDPDHQPDAFELYRKLTEMENQAALNGGLYFEDALADLNAVSGASEGDTGFVLDDGTAANNGVYLRGASSWSKTSDLPGAFSDSIGALAAVALEQARAEAAEAALSDDIDAEATARANAISTEAGARASGDTALADDIAAEADARADGDAALAASIAALGDLAQKDTVDTADIATSAVTNAKMANMSEARFKGRKAGAGSGPPQDMTASEARTAMGLGSAATTEAGAYATATQGGKADSAVQPGAAVSVLAETETAKIMTGDERTAVAQHTIDIADATLERLILRAVQQVLATSGITPMGPNNLGLLYGVKIGNRVLFGQRPSGTTYMGTVLLEVTGENNLGVVWGIAAQSSDGKLRLLIGITSDGVIVGADVESRSRIELLITTGQSLAEGAGTAITTTAPYTGGEALKFANGPVGKQSEVTGPGIVALAEQTNETITTGMARRILATHPDRTLLGMGQAWGGETIEEISLGGGSGVYEKIQDQIDLAAAQSRGAVARIVNMINGEANGLLSSTDFHLKLEAYRQQFAIDCAERLGQTEVPYLFTCQTSSVAGYKGGSIALRDSFTTPFLQLRAALTNPLIVLVGPKYQYTYLDHSHIDSLSTRLHGEKYGQVYRQVITDQRQWLPVHASNVVRDNDAIVITLHSPVSMPIEIDDVAVTDPGDLGFNLLDAGGVTIGSVTQTGDYEVTVECSGNVPDGSRLSYAFHNGTSGTSGWDTGARGCIRDSDPTRSIYTNAAMPNWLVAFQTNF